MDGRLGGKRRDIGGQANQHSHTGIRMNRRKEKSIGGEDDENSHWTERQTFEHPQKKLENLCKHERGVQSITLCDSTLQLLREESISKLQPQRGVNDPSPCRRSPGEDLVLRVRVRDYLPSLHEHWWFFYFLTHPLTALTATDCQTSMRCGHGFA